MSREEQRKIAGAIQAAFDSRDRGEWVLRAAEDALEAFLKTCAPEAKAAFVARAGEKLTLPSGPIEIFRARVKEPGGRTGTVSGEMCSIDGHFAFVKWDDGGGCPIRQGDGGVREVLLKDGDEWIAASVVKEWVTAAPERSWAELNQKPPRTNGGVRCDVDDGPCSCGAWHRPIDPEVVANPAVPSWAVLLKEGEKFRDADFNTYTVRSEYGRSHGTLLVERNGGKAAAYVPATWIAKHCVKVDDEPSGDARTVTEDEVKRIASLFFDKSGWTKHDGWQPADVVRLVLRAAGLKVQCDDE